MANLHVLTKTENDVTVAAHIAIPATSNTAGVSWRTALINSGLGGATVLKDGDGTGGTISAAEKTQLATGALYEVVDQIHVSIPSGAAAINAYLDSRYSEISARALAFLQDRLNYFGYSRG